MKTVRSNLPHDWDYGKKGILGSADIMVVPKGFREQMVNYPVQYFKELKKAREQTNGYINLELAADHPSLKPLTIFNNFMTANAAEYARNSSLMAYYKSLLEIEAVQYELQSKLANQGLSSNPADYL